MSDTVSATSKGASVAWALLLPLALAQFICSYAASSMNVAISDIASDLGTTVRGVQTAMTVFTLTMAALMIPGSKLTDIWGRKFCLMLGLVIYAAGALVAALAQGLGTLIVGYSLLEGIGSALLIPPVYILVTVSFPILTTRAKSFGIISAAAGLGASAGPLIGGLITSAMSWRASFILQVLIVALIIVLSRRIADPGITGPRPRFDLLGAFLSAAGLVFVVIGVLQSGEYGWFVAKTDFSIGSTVLISKGGISPVWLFVGIGAAFLVWFFLHIRSDESAGRKPLLATHLFKNHTSNLGLITQNLQWLILQGTFFSLSVFFQSVHGYSAVETGLALTPAIVGTLVTSLVAGRLAKKYQQRVLIRGGFAGTVAGMLLLLWLSSVGSSYLAFVPGLVLIGLGVGVMLTSSVNVVQSSFPEKDQGEISGLSRSVSNLGSSLGTAIVGSVLVSTAVVGNRVYALALVTLALFGAIGFVAAMLIPPPHRDNEGEGAIPAERSVQTSGQ